MKKKLLATLLSASMVMGIAACGSSTAETPAPADTTATQTETKTETTTETASSDTAAETPAIDTSEHVVITYMTTGGAPEGNQTDAMLEQLNKILTEKVNAELEVYYIDWTDYLSNYNLTLARMDGTVDLVGTASDWLDAWPNAKNGAFLELSEDMLKTYAPKTWASVSE